MENFFNYLATETDPQNIKAFFVTQYAGCSMEEALEKLKETEAQRQDDKDFLTVDAFCKKLASMTDQVAVLKYFYKDFLPEITAIFERRSPEVFQEVLDMMEPDDQLSPTPEFNATDFRYYFKQIFILPSIPNNSASMVIKIDADIFEPGFKILFYEDYLSATLNLNCENAKERKNSLHKLTRLIDFLSDLLQFEKEQEGKAESEHYFEKIFIGEGIAALTYKKSTSYHYCGLKLYMFQDKNEHVFIEFGEHTREILTTMITHLTDLKNFMLSEFNRLKLAYQSKEMQPKRFLKAG